LVVEDVLAQAVANNVLTADQARRKNRTFRGADLVPWLARQVFVQLANFTGKPFNLGAAPRPTGRVARIDTRKFGNVFLDCLPEDVGFEPGRWIQLANGDRVQCYGDFHDVPPGQLGLTVGSSGFGDNCFLKLTVMGKSAAKRLRLRPGDQALAPSAVLVSALS
jgi:hypothetical protein